MMPITIKKRLECREKRDFNCFPFNYMAIILTDIKEHKDCLPGPSSLKKEVIGII